MTQVRESIPTYEDTLKYWSLVIIEGLTSNAAHIELPLSLKITNSDYFEKILFVVIGCFPKQLAADFAAYQQQEGKGKLPENVHYIKSDQ
jgi:hypothetical protein